MGIRILKTAAAAMIAVYIAQFFHLSGALSAGLLAVLGVDVTIKKGLRTVSARLLASIFALMAGTVLFYIFGFQVWVLCLFILSVYPILSRARLQDGIVTGTVVMLHLFSAGALSGKLLINEIMLLVIGLGSATAINMLYMPKADTKLERCKERTEDAFSKIFGKIAESLRDTRLVWDGAELIDAGQEIAAGEKLARRSVENTLFREDRDWPIYFAMRRQQLDSIERMMELVAQVYETFEHGETMSELFELLSGDVKKEHYTGNVEKRLIEMRTAFRAMPLPATRSEFEVRAALLQLMVELVTFLNIAKKLKKQKADKLV